jgi:hypothetical protein
MILNSWAQVVVVSLQNLWASIIRFVPNILGALIVFIIGLIVASALGALVERIFQAIRFDSFLNRIGLEPYFRRAGLKLRGAYFLGRVVFWFLVIVFLLAVSDALGLFALSGFLHDVLVFIPNVIVAVLIMLAAVVLANFIRRLITASVASAQLHASHFLGNLAWWAIVIFGLLAALVQLNIAVTIINTVVMGIVAMIALAGGLAFGLGGREAATRWISRIGEGR